MAIRADLAHADAVLLLTDHSADAFFVGYELARESDSATWLDWTGTAWGVGPALLATNRFTDYSMSPGLFRYRARARYEEVPGVFTYSDYEFSPWIRIASSSSEKVGWTLGNYVVPPESFGEVLTPDDMRHTYLWGVPFTSSGGAQYTDPQIKAMIDSTVAEFEHYLNISIRKRVILCADDVNEDAEYDELEDAYYYKRMNWNVGGRLNTKRRPILSVQRFQLYTVTQGLILDLRPWLRIDHKKGVLHFYPRINPGSTSMQVSPAFFSFGNLRSVDYNHGYRLDYTVGYENASKVPEDLRDIIGKAAACRLLNIIGDGLIAGFASMSLGMDGLSESLSTTQSATNAFYGARIGVYLKDIEDWLNRNARKFGSQVMGAI